MKLFTQHSLASRYLPLAIACQPKTESEVTQHPLDKGLAVGRHRLMGKQNLYDLSIKVPPIIIIPAAYKKQKGESKLTFEEMQKIYVYE